MKKLKKAFSFTGRITRGEHMLTYLILVAFFVKGGIIENLQFMPEIFIKLTAALLIWLLLAQIAKRCHDIGKSAWFILIPYFALYLFFAKGDKGTNKYGVNPRIK